MTSVERSATHPRTVNVFGYEVFDQPLSTIPLESDRCRTLNTIGPDTYGISVNDPVAEAAFKASDYLVLDGVYFALASILTRGEAITPNQGPDVFDHFMKRLNDGGGRAFFLGAAPATIEKIKARTAELYPNIACDGLSPPFKPEFTDEDHDAMVAAVNAFRPDIVFIGINDLAGNIGLLGQTEHPEVQALARQAEKAILDAGKVLGTVPNGGASVNDLLDRGYRFIVGPHNIALLRDATARALGEYQSLKQARERGEKPSVEMKGKSY